MLVGASLVRDVSISDETRPCQICCPGERDALVLPTSNRCCRAWVSEVRATMGLASGARPPYLTHPAARKLLASWCEIRCISPGLSLTRLSKPAEGRSAHHRGSHAPRLTCPEVRFTCPEVHKPRSSQALSALALGNRVDLTGNELTGIVFTGIELIAIERAGMRPLRPRAPSARP
jgi:hypothetical protein